jgi:hypothetical protein
MLTVITPTGDRPQAFALCCKYMLRQTLPAGEFFWVIVNDGREELIFPDDFFATYLGMRTIIIGIKHHQPAGVHTLNSNLSIALESRLLPQGIFAIVEDDDWYHPRYLERIAAQFSRWPYHHTGCGPWLDADDKPIDAPLDLLGESPSLYYHLPTRQYAIQANTHTPALCSTAFSARLIPKIIELCRDPNPSVDYRLWTLAHSATDIQSCNLPVREPGNDADDGVIDARYVVGLKGLPGRPGIGGGHVLAGPAESWKPDPDGTILRRFIGDDADAYLGMKFN